MPSINSIKILSDRVRLENKKADLEEELRAVNAEIDRNEATIANTLIKDNTAQFPLDALIVIRVDGIDYGIETDGTDGGIKPYVSKIQKVHQIDQNAN